MTSLEPTTIQSSTNNGCTTYEQESLTLVFERCLHANGYLGLRNGSFALSHVEIARQMKVDQFNLCLKWVNGRIWEGNFSHGNKTLQIVGRFNG